MFYGTTHDSMNLDGGSETLNLLCVVRIEVMRADNHNNNDNDDNNHNNDDNSNTY